MSTTTPPAGWVPTNRKLGKLKPLYDPRVPLLSNLVSLPAQPPTADWYSAVESDESWPMLLNDSLGDCVPAGGLHVIEQRLAYAENPYVPTDADAEVAYEQWAGWNPANPVATDNGTSMSQAMHRWMVNGLKLSNGYLDQITNYAVVDQFTSDAWLKYAISHFGHVLIGFNCPESFLSVQPGGIWDVLNNQPGRIAGGHCVPLVGYETTAVGGVEMVTFEAISWAMRIKFTLRAVRDLADECYVVMDKDWLNKAGLDPTGVDWAASEAAMVVLREAA